MPVAHCTRQTDSDKKAKAENPVIFYNDSLLDCITATHYVLLFVSYTFNGFSSNRVQSYSIILSKLSSKSTPVLFIYPTPPELPGVIPLPFAGSFNVYSSLLMIMFS